MYSKYQFEDEKAGWANAKGKWHVWGMAIRVLIFAALLCYQFFPFDFWDLLLAGVINIIIWDIGINVVALHVKWNYAGSTAENDKKLGGKKWYIYLVLLIGSFITKFKNHKNKTK